MEKNFKFVALQASFFALFCTSYVFANPMLSEKNFEISEIGFILTFSAFLSIILQPLMAKLISHFRIITNKRILIFFMIISLLSTLIYLSSDNKFLISFTIITVISSLLTVQTFIYTFILEYINNGVKINFGLTRGGGSVSFAITSLLVGIIAKKYGYSFISILNIILELLILFILISFKDIQHIKYINEVKKNKNFIEFSKKYKKFLLFLIGIFLILTTHNVFSTYLINIAKEVNKDSDFVGILLFIAAILELPVMSYFNYFRKKYSNYTLLYLSVISFTLKSITIFVGISLSMPNIIVISQFMQMLGFALYLPASVFYVNNIMDKEDKIMGQAYLGVFGTFGSIFSAYLAANLIDFIGVKYMVLVFSIISLIGTIIVIFSLERDHIYE